MKKLSFLVLALCVGIFSPVTAHAWDVCETEVETLDVAGEVTFTSSFCDCVDADIITIQIIQADPAVVIDRVEFKKATPHWQTNESWAAQTAVDPYAANVILHKWTEKTHTIHLWLYLSTGEHIGVNAHF